MSNNFPIITLNALEMTMSDHVPLVLHCRQNHTAWKPFRLENFWLEYPQVKQIISEIWMAPVLTNNLANKFMMRTQKLQVALRASHLQNFKLSNEELAQCNAQILQLDKLEETRPLEQQ